MQVERDVTKVLLCLEVGFFSTKTTPGINTFNDFFFFSYVFGVFPSSLKWCFSGVVLLGLWGFFGFFCGGFVCVYKGFFVL